MVTTLEIHKRYGTYADPFLLLGLAQVVYMTQLQLTGRKGVQLIDLGARYQIQLATAIAPEDIVQQVTFEPLFDLVKGDKTEAPSGMEWEQVTHFDTVQHRDIRNRWREYERQRKFEKGKLELSEEDTPPKPDPRTQNGVILTSMRHDRNHNGLWESAQEVRDDFGALVAAMFQTFDAARETEGESAEIAACFKQLTGKSLPTPASAVKLFMPTAVQGVNRLKADNNMSSGGQKDSWVVLWLIAAGLFHYGVSERIKIAEGSYDWRVVALEPKEISLLNYGDVLNALRGFNPPSGAYGVARFDAETVLNLSLELLNYHPAKATKTTPTRQRGRGTPLKQIVSKFSGTHFGSKGQVYGVKEIFSLGIPNWICPSHDQEVSDYQFVLKEHQSIVRSLSADEGNGELLAAYRDFITSSDLFQFFRFQVSYADYVVKRLADPKVRFVPPRFSQDGLDIMTQSFDKSDQDWSIAEITQNTGFQRIARAINSATVYAGKIRTTQGQIELDWQRTYGLAQRLSNHAGSKKDFIAELTAFLTTYDNENLRLSEQLQKDGKSLKRVWVTTEDLEQFLALLDDKRFGCNLVANLLLAYGYAKWKQPLAGEKEAPAIATDDLEA